MSGILASLGINWIEIVAVAFGLVSVWLSARLHIVAWPTAIVNVGIFFFLFWDAKLYADSVLQLFYLALSVYGWWAWLHGGERGSKLRVSRAGRRVWLIIAPLVAIGGLALGTLLDLHTDSPAPYLDAMLTATSLFAQWMMTRKILENWIVWIAADIVYVPMFISRDLPFTSVQYAVFLILAVMGYRGWRRSWEADRAADLAAAAATAPTARTTAAGAP